MLKKLVILLVMIVLLVPFTLSFDLSNFPLPFFPHPCTNVYWLIGSSLADDEPFRIINGKFFIGFVPENAPYCGPEPSSGFLDSEFGSEKYKKQNILSIGGPCANKVTAQIMSIPTSWPECATGFENGTGRIILFNKWNKTQLIVAGYGAEDTKRAAKVLTNYESYSFNGTMIDITNKNGTLNVYEVYEIDPRKVPLNSLIIDFNNAGKNGLIASTQTNFTNHFQSEINKLALDYGLIKSIEIKHWYSALNGASIRFNYKENLDDKTKLSLLNEIKFMLENKWYTSKVWYDGYVSTTRPIIEKSSSKP